MERRIFSPFVKAAIISCLISLLYLGIYPLHILEPLRLKTQDFFFMVRHLFPYHNPVLREIFLITVDDESIDKIKDRWPFKRRIYADLLDKVGLAGPRVLAMDFIFAGKGEPLDNFLLSEAIQKLGNVVLSAFVDADGNYVLSLKELRERAKGSGVVNKLLDKDFQVRRAQLFYRDQTGKIVAWPWEIEILMTLFGIDRENFKATGDGVRFESKDRSFFIPLYHEKQAAINYRFDLKDVNQLPLWKALEAKDLTDEIRGKVVLVGATSKVLHDYYHTPLGMMPGVIVNMNWLANILTNDFLKPVPLFINCLFVVLFAFLSSYLGVRYDVVRGLTILSISTLVFLGVFFSLFWNSYSGDYFSPLLGGWLAFLVTTFYRYFYILIENVRLRGEVATDPLTGLYNRRFLESRIDDELTKLASERRGRKTDPFHELSVLMIDVDNFKNINDTYGHQFGDDVLKNVSFSIKESTRKDDVVARFGGEEFCVVLTHTNMEEAIQIADKIRKSVEAKKLSYGNQVARFTISLGVASARADNLLSSRAIIRAADSALYDAKRTGKNRVCIYTP